MEKAKAFSYYWLQMLWFMGRYRYNYNKKPDWEKKSMDYFYPKPFKKTHAIKRGIEYKPSARVAYETLMNVKVVSEINPWLGYNPDGIVIDTNQKPFKLIIKNKMSIC